VRIFLELVPNKITILSQYRAQCSAIEKQLERFGYKNPNVGTVIASQGMSSVFQLCCFSDSELCIATLFLVLQLLLLLLLVVNVVIQLRAFLRQQYVFVCPQIESAL